LSLLLLSYLVGSEWMKNWKIQTPAVAIVRVVLARESSLYSHSLNPNEVVHLLDPMEAVLAKTEVVVVVVAAAADFAAAVVVVLAVVVAVDAALHEFETDAADFPFQV